MKKTILRALIIGTVLYLTLLGLGLIGLRPAFELAVFFSVPSIYVVGPLMCLLPYDWLEGPLGGVMVIMVSTWLELMLMAFAGTLIFNRVKIILATRRNNDN